MKLQEAISILKIHQKWRLGADIVMIEPKELTEAIDTLLNYHIVDTNEMIFSQIEISDEEIEKAAPVGNLIAELSWINGAKWYREQLKIKGNGNK